MKKGVYQRGQCILIPVVFTLSPLRHHGSVWLLLVPVISLLFLTNTVSPVVGLPIHMIRMERNWDKNYTERSVNAAFMAIDL
jgi:hypothetical protein